MRLIVWALATALAFSAGVATRPALALAKSKKQQAEPAGGTAPATRPSVQPKPEPPKSQSKPAPDQPHMRRALKQLELAQYDLSQAGRGKGGWVQVAQGHVSSAIGHVRQGIAFGETH